MFDGAIAVPWRNQQMQVEALGAASDSREMVSLIGGTGKPGRWIGEAGLRATAVTLQPDLTLGDAAPVTAAGSASVAVGSGRIVGILAPANNTKPAIWFGADLSDTRVTSQGSEGLLKKRPATVVISGPGFEFALSQVGEVFGTRWQAGRRLSLLAALGVH